MSDNFYNANGILKQITMNYAVTRLNSNSNYACQNIAGTGGGRFTFIIPGNFISAVSLNLICSPSAGAAGAGKDIDFTSSYGLVGENIDINSESATTTVYNLGVVDTFTTLNILPVFSSLAANHVCGIFVDHNGVGGSISYYGIRLVYNGSVS